MTLSGTMVRQVPIKSACHVFHEICRDRPHHIPEMSPTGFIKGVNLHDGAWGVLGSVFVFDYIHEGKEKVAKEVLHAIDEEKKSVCYKVIGGDIMEDYKTFLITVHVDTNGEDNLVTWTFDYEKLNENVDVPESLMDFCLRMTKDMDSHQHQITNSN